jgi:hypothetical protein
MDTVFVKPAEGGRIRQPDRNSQVMPAAGALVPRDGYYERLIASGDLIETTPPAPPKAPKAPPPPPPDRDDIR